MGERVAAAKTTAEALDAALAEIDEANKTGQPIEEAGSREEAPEEEAQPGRKLPGDAENQARRREVPEDNGEKRAPREEEDDDPIEEYGYRGKPVRIRKSKVRELVEKGYDYEVKSARLNDMRQTLEAERDGLETYKAYREWLRSHPGAAKAISNLISHVEENGVVPLVDLEQPSPSQDAGDNLPPGIINALERINRRLDQMELRGASEDVGKRLVRAVNSNPILKRIADSSPQLERLVLQKLTSSLQADPGADIDGVAQAVATEWGAVAETLGASTKYAKEKDEAKQRFRHSERPDDATPGPDMPAPPKLTGADLKSGRVRKEAKAWLDRMFG